MEPTTLIIGGLATWRLSRALVKESGPKMIFAKLRANLAKNQKNSGGLFDMISCMACTSFWIGVLAALVPAETFFHVFGYALAFSAISLILEALTSSQGYITTSNANNEKNITK